MPDTRINATLAPYLSSGWVVVAGNQGGSSNSAWSILLQCIGR